MSWAAVTVVGALVLGLVPQVAWEQPALAADRGGLSGSQKALQSAQDSGEMVEVPSERSEYSTVYANPDGETFTLRQSAEPVRVAKADGGWEKPDPTLVRHSDGSIGPKAAMVGMELSAGGPDGLATIGNPGRSLAVDWPGSLPEPTLDGATATYGNVLPDVDLKVTTSVKGFRHVLVVKTPEAAENPDLKQLDFALKSQGVTVRETTSGGMAALDANGQQVFAAPSAHMWDSSGGAEASVATRPKSAAIEAEPVPGSSAVEPERDDGPAPGDRVAEMEMNVSEDELSVVPDADMLSGTSADAFPLYIDPHVTWGEYERTLVRSDGYKDYDWSGEKGVGECGSWSGYYCGPGYRQRLIFEFSPSKLRGKHVLDATFRVTETWSFSCDPTWLQLWRTNSMSGSTEWPGPQKINMMGDRHVSAGRGDACDPSQPAKPIEFNDNPNESNENLTPTVRSFAKGNFPRMTLMLKSQDETTTKGWKRFKHDAVLDVKFVGKPARPTGVGLRVSGGTACEHDGTDPQVSADPTPGLAATARTESGGQSGAQLKAYFDIDVQNGDESWSDVTPGQGSVRPSSGFVGDGTPVNMSWSPELDEGPLYRYRAWTQSYYGSTFLKGPSNATGDGWCYFIVDATAPKAPNLSLSSPYEECESESCPANGGPGTQGMITATPAEGDVVEAMQYQVSGSDEWAAMDEAGGSFAADVIPEQSGTLRVEVRAKDAAGWGETAQIDFLVAAGEGPIARWHFDEDSGVAVDSATQADSAQQNATLGDGASRDEQGRRGVITHDAEGNPLATPTVDRGLSLDGTGAHAATDGPVLETRSAYTVSAWARLNSTDSTGIVLSQDGANYTPFLLWYETKYETWMFGVKESDEDTGSAYYGIVTDHGAVPGVWTHLAGTYDPSSQQLRLYVNGKLQGTREVPGSWNSLGDFQIGRYLWAGGRYHDFNGSIDEVAVWQRELTDTEIADEARLLTSSERAGVELIAAWNPETGSGTTVPDDTSGYGRDLTLTGGASLDGGTVLLDGADDAAKAPGPLVDDTGSFTATTLLEPNSAKLAAEPVGYTAQVLEQPAADGSSWGAWFEVTGKRSVLDDDGVEQTVAEGLWHFGRPGSGITAQEPTLMDGSEVRLTGIYDAPSGTVTLYVASEQQGEPKVYSAQVGQGDFLLGRSSSGDHFPGRVGDIRVWAGAMAGREQILETITE